MSPVDAAFAHAMPAARLPVRQMLGATCRVLAARALPFGIIILVLAGVTEGCSYLAARAARLTDDPQLLLTVITGGGEMLALIVTEIMSVIVGVVWLRIMLLGEPHRARAYLRFGRRELCYLGIDILFGIAVSAPVAIGFRILAYGGAMPYLGGDMAWMDSYLLPLFLGVALWSAVCAAWLGLAFPAVATDATGGSIGLSWRLSRGQRLPLFAAFLMGAYGWSVLPVAVLYAAPAYTPIIAFLSTMLSFLPRMGFLAVSAVAYGRLQQHSLTSVAATFD